MVVAYIQTPTPRAAAEAFRLLLATERGYTSSIRTAPSGAVIVRASDGKAVRFECPREEMNRD